MGKVIQLRPKARGGTPRRRPVPGEVVRRKDGTVVRLVRLDNVRAA